MWGILTGILTGDRPVARRLAGWGFTVDKPASHEGSGEGFPLASARGTIEEEASVCVVGSAEADQFLGYCGWCHAGFHFEVDGFHFGDDVLCVAFHDDDACGGVELLEVVLELSAFVVCFPALCDYVFDCWGGFVWRAFLASAKPSASVVFLSWHFLLL